MLDNWSLRDKRYKSHQFKQFLKTICHKKLMIPPILFDDTANFCSSTQSKTHFKPYMQHFKQFLKTSCHKQLMIPPMLDSFSKSLNSLNIRPKAHCKETKWSQTKSEVKFFLSAAILKTWTLVIASTALHPSKF
jgi:hypothetical protein